MVLRCAVRHNSRQPADVHDHEESPTADERPQEGSRAETSNEKMCKGEMKRGVVHCIAWHGRWAWAVPQDDRVGATRESEKSFQGSVGKEPAASNARHCKSTGQAHRCCRTRSMDPWIVRSRWFKVHAKSYKSYKKQRAKPLSCKIDVQGGQMTWGHCGPLADSIGRSVPSARLLPDQAKPPWD